jgi:hypothetical protein
LKDPIEHAAEANRAPEDLGKAEGRVAEELEYLAPQRCIGELFEKRNPI